MIVVMASSDSPRLTLATASRDFLATVDYPLRPAVSRSWGKPQRPRTRWKCCYFPQSFPVYRMQRLVSVVLCLLGLLLLSLVAFVLVQVAPTSQVLRGGLVMAANTRNNGMSADDNRKWDVGLGVGRTARKLEDHPEYKRSAEENDSDDDALDEADDEDDLVLNDNYEEEEEEEEEENNNPVFDMAYFDFSIKEGDADPHSSKTNSAAEQQITGSSFFKTPTVLGKWKDLPRLSLVNDYGLEVIEDGVVFSSSVEALLKEERLSDAMVGQVQEKLRSQEVTGLKEPTWERCGRPKNQWVELGSGSSAACARYRYPDDYLLVGEVLSFYLSRLLGVGHVPPVALSDPASGRWEPVASQMSAAGWGDAPVVVLTPWVHGLVRDHMPSILLDILLKNSTLSILEEEEEGEKEASQMPVDGYEGHKVYKVAGLKDQRTLKQSVDGETKRQSEGKSRQVSRGSRGLKQAAERDLVRLLQWSDLLVFDYLTGNYDRVAYMQDAAEKEGRPQILTGTIHNLVRSEATDALWLLDNESGLVDAYTLLYGTADPVQSARFSAFHTRMLKSMCVFRRSTMEAILGLAHHPAPQTLLVDFVKLHEPLFGRLPDPLENKLFMKHFPQRLAQVHDWMVKCAERVQEPPKTSLRKR